MRTLIYNCLLTLSPFKEDDAVKNKFKYNIVEAMKYIQLHCI